MFYPSTQTKKLEYYAQFFDTVELDATFYEKFYKYMTKDTFRTMTKVTPDNFQFFSYQSGDGFRYQIRSSGKSRLCGFTDLLHAGTY